MAIMQYSVYISLDFWCSCLLMADFWLITGRPLHHNILLVLFFYNRPKSDIKIAMARAVVEEFPFLKDEEGQGFVSVIASKIMIKCPTYIHVELLTLYKNIVLGFWCA